MDEILLLASDDGLLKCEPDGSGWKEIGRALAGQRLTGVIAREGVILAGGHSGVYRSDDRGTTWRTCNRGLTTTYVRTLAYNPQISDFELVGVEPAGIFVSRDGAENWRVCPEVAELRDRFGWQLPYSPAAGCVRGFAFHQDRAYAAVEDGCLLRSEDGGKTWHLAEGSYGSPNHHPEPGRLHSDVHSVATHPLSPDLVYAPTGGGFYRSWDGGRTWQRRYPVCYVRAVWVDPADAEHLVLGPADGVDRNGRIEESLDGGLTWKVAGDVSGAPWAHHMVERFFQVENRLFAVLSNGELLAANVGKWTWQPVCAGAPPIRALAALAW